ncbi:chemotaxis protein CheA, partial [Aminiphilus sp.]|uniref:chemotaxis protein CheA n=1 Tax=Aminiphilus sp. TaxID=1872488 RepID=UPI00262247AC
MPDERDVVRRLIDGEEDKAEGGGFSEFLEDFLAETKEHLESIELGVLELENDPGNCDMVHGIFRSFHTIKGLAGFVNQSLVQKIAHAVETILDECRKGNIRPSKRVVDAILAGADLLGRICNDVRLVRDAAFLEEVRSHLLGFENWKKEEGAVPGQACRLSSSEKAMPSGASGDGKNISASLPSPEVSRNEEARSLRDGEEGAPGAPAESGMEPSPESAPSEARNARKNAAPREVLPGGSAQRNTTASGELIRISTHKVDNLADMLGELLITQSQVEQQVVTRFGPNDSLVSHLLRMSRITRELQNLAMSLSMVSLRSTFQKLQRIARDTIQELGKNAEFVISGEDTEIDRSVAEKLLDPLVHMVKNAISHGIESPEDRASRGKTRQGTVTVSAYSRRGNVFIEVADDGRGMDPEGILRKAQEKNLADPSRNYSEEEILGFVFLPGFSTLAVANTVSGRGVGMDVVRTEISRIGGKVEIRNTPGKGCTFVLKIPINMAVLNGTIVNIFGEHYILPTLHVKQILKPEDGQWISVGGREIMLRVRENVVPVIPVDAVFGCPGEFERSFDGTLMVVMELEQQIKALPVRAVLGRREIVVKPLGKEFASLEFVSGASILGDGKVSLIL